MSLKNIFYYLSTLIFSISNVSASFSSSSSFDLKESSSKIRKFKDTYWDVDVSPELLLKSFHQVDEDALRDAEEILAEKGMTDTERRIQQAKIMHEDAKFAFNLACQEYRILLEQGKIERFKDKASPESLEYLNLVKKQEIIKGDPYSDLTRLTRRVHSLDATNFYLVPYIYDPTQKDREFAKNLSTKLNGPVLSVEQGMVIDSNFINIPVDHADFSYIGERKFHFYDDFEGNKELEAAYGIYTKKVNGGAGLNDMDVHAYNRKFNFKEFLPKILASDKTSNESVSASVVIGAMQKTPVYKSYAKQGTLNASFSRLLSHLKTQKVEVKETGVNVEKILSRIWSLIVKDPFEINNLFRVFCDNEETYGGCFPGHAGRLADFYVKVFRSKHITKHFIYYN